MGHVHNLRPMPEAWLHGIECDGCDFVMGERDAASLLTEALAALEAQDAHYKARADLDVPYPAVVALEQWAYHLHKIALTKARGE